MKNAEKLINWINRFKKFKYAMFMKKEMISAAADAFARGLAEDHKFLGTLPGVSKSAALSGSANAPLILKINTAVKKPSTAVIQVYIPSRYANSKKSLITTKATRYARETIEAKIGEFIQQFNL